ncbi:hypothetical protein CY35_13G061300 [Sphagnum magellanicum]|nr:hypothetical protein CY35_13G061300 [Sphagnum magellanicum]
MGHWSFLSYFLKLVDSATSSSSLSSSCWKKSDYTSTFFFGDVMDHIDKFVHTSMDGHKNCFKNVLNKMFGTSKATSAIMTTKGSTPTIENMMPRPTTFD